MKKPWVILMGIIAISLATLVGFILTKKVEGSDTITAHYTILLTDGTVYYSSLGDRPLQETLGDGKFISGFEEALIGMHVGQSKTVVIPVEKAYGEYNPDLVGTVNRDRLPEGLEPVIGQRVSAEFRDGSPTIATITGFTDTTVTLDANHPMAGLELIFDIQLLGIDNHRPLGRLTNLTVFSRSFLALGILIIGSAFFYFTKLGGFQKMKTRGLGSILALRNLLVGLRLRSVDWFRISLVVVGTLFLGYALMSALVGKKAGVGDTVSVHYTLKLENGMLYNGTPEDEPLQFTLGEGKLIPDIEEALLGMRVGETKSVRILPEKAYGPYRPELVFEYDRSELPEGSQPLVGQQVETTQEDGTPLTMIVSDVTEKTVTMDANYPLAGQTLTFDIQVVGVEKKLAADIGAYLGWALLLLGILASVFVFLKHRNLLVSTIAGKIRTRKLAHR